MTDQLIFTFPTIKNYSKEDFYVSPSNREAYDFINSFSLKDTPVKRLGE